jgi:hypothetical protein
MIGQWQQHEIEEKTWKIQCTHIQLIGEVNRYPSSKEGARRNDDKQI